MVGVGPGGGRATTTPLAPHRVEWDLVEDG